MMRLLEEHTRNNLQEWEQFDAAKQHVSCIAHVVNLAVQALLGKRGLGAGTPEEIGDMADIEDSKSQSIVNIEDDDDSEVLVSFEIGGEATNDIGLSGSN
ncbi:hypothetical protein BGW38_007576, partial [Lunasporangiospora selenospora]